MTGPNTLAICARSPKLAQGVVSVANTDRTGATGTVVQLKTTNANYSTGSDGALLVSWFYKATVTTTLGNVRLFASDGTTKYLIGELSVSAITVAAGTNGASGSEVLNLELPPAYTLHATTEKGEAIHIGARVLDF